ncbi:Magnesium and cobalt transport protein CorA [uncultured Paludibacter sp.]|nr:Magnesium and cobalt transport protein CorA [uncultured Paludibacter sp.]
MARFSKKRKEDIGLSPYAMVFRGQKKREKPLIRTIDFNLDFVHEMEIKSVEKLAEFKNEDTITWLNIDGLDNIQLMEKLAEIFKIENSVMSDIMNPSLRPTVREFENGLFITLKMIEPNQNTGRLSVENLSLVLTESVLISFQEEKGDVFEPVRERIRKHKNKIRTAGTDYLAFALLDIVVDNYIYVIGLLGDKIEYLEDKMSQNPSKELLALINTYKQELNLIRKYIKPAKEMILNLAKMESEFIHEENRVNYKELQDNINEASELTDSYREILYDILNIYHTSATTRLNDIMKVLTIISVIFIPLTFIVGIYGTNFKYLPEIEWKYGYFAMWGIMIIVAAFMVWYFKRKKWF